MKKYLCIVISIIMALFLTSCTSGEDNQAVRDSVEAARQALIEFDTNEFEKYAKSETLDAIEGQTAVYPQINTLAQEIFKELEIEVKRVKINDEKGTGTATLKIRNKALKEPASDYVSSMVTQYLQGNVDLKDSTFINEQLEALCKIVEGAETGDWVKVKVDVEKRNDGTWIIVFNDDAEDAVMGGAASVIKNITKLA